MISPPSRIIHCADALEWLERHPVTPGTSFVSSLPDFSEFPDKSLEQWKAWFIATASLILSRCPDDGVTVFFQSDIKIDGLWVDKGYLCQKAAEASGHGLLWHKAMCRSPAGTVTFGRPAWSHVLCFSRSLRPSLELSTADVLPGPGDKTWVRGMGLAPALMVVRFIAEATPSHTVINPFCGEGSVLAAANATGLDAIGIERSPKRAERAGRLMVESDLKSWKKPS